MMDQYLGILYEVLVCQLKKSKPGDELKESMTALEKSTRNKNNLFVVISINLVKSNVE